MKEETLKSWTECGSFSCEQSKILLNFLKALIQYAELQVGRSTE